VHVVDPSAVSLTAQPDTAVGGWRQDHCAGQSLAVVHWMTFTLQCDVARVVQEHIGEGAGDGVVEVVPASAAEAGWSGVPPALGDVEGVGLEPVPAEPAHPHSVSARQVNPSPQSALA
jgi:hypothetical protein